MTGIGQSIKKIAYLSAVLADAGWLLREASLSSGIIPRSYYPLYLHYRLICHLGVRLECLWSQNNQVFYRPALNLSLHFILCHVYAYLCSLSGVIVTLYPSSSDSHRMLKLHDGDGKITIQLLGKGAIPLSAISFVQVDHVHSEPHTCQVLLLRPAIYTRLPQLDSAPALDRIRTQTLHLATMDHAP